MLKVSQGLLLTSIRAPFGSSAERKCHYSIWANAIILYGRMPLFYMGECHSPLLTSDLGVVL
ncbi:MAG: hypothetical protein SWX82_16455 [Cyanobacteriota bacterium]|nr:hypothetical protein [Cyanobacteriota bacterium]